jgi:hypothetical protein
MITELAQDLINRIIEVPAFEQRVGMMVGGTEADPNMTKSPFPFAWVIYGGSAQAGEAREGGKVYRETKFLFNVSIGLKYGISEADILNNQLPVLEAVQQSVAGQKPFDRVGRWEYDGESLDALTPDRMIYTMRFSIVGYLQTPNT